MTQVTFAKTHGMLPGDRIQFLGEPNSVRRVVAGIRGTESQTSLRVITFIRPSKGFARYIRRRKTKARIN